MTNERTIEVKVTKEDLEQMRAEGISEQDLSETGGKALSSGATYYQK